MKLFLLILLFVFPALSQQIPLATQQQGYLQNPLTNPGFENGTQGWSTANSATMSADSTNALSGARSLSFSLPSVIGAQIRSPLFVIPKGWYSQRCYIKMNYGSISSTGAQVQVYDQTAATVFSGASLPTGTGVNRQEFVCPASGSLQLRLVRAVGFSITGYIDDVEFGLVQPEEVGKWKEFTPTFTGFGSVTSVKAFWRKVGQNLEVYGRATAGTVTASGATIIFSSLGVNIDTSLIVSDATRGQVFGEFQRENTDAASFSIGALNTFTNYVYISDSQTQGGLRDSDGNAIVASNEKFSFKFSVPILEWR